METVLDTINHTLLTLSVWFGTLLGTTNLQALPVESTVASGRVIPPVQRIVQW